MSNLGRRIALVNGRIVTPTAILANHWLLVEDGRIVDVTATNPGPGWEMVDVADRLVTPGLVDIHIHGAMGRSFNEADASAFAEIAAAAARSGVTSLLATTATAPIAELVECLETAHRWMHAGKADSPFANILGVHVEGPYFSLAQAGAQDPANLRTPDDGSADQLLDHADVIRMMTLAPELPGALTLVRRLVALGIVPAAGHSSAKEEEIIPAIEAGLRHMIHIWSGQSTTVRVGPWRKPGMLEVTLVDERLTAEMISDNRHLPPTLMRLAYKCIGADRLCAISDATSGAGLPEGSRFRMGHMEYEVENGVGMLLDRSAFAGSTTLLNAMLPVLVHEVGIPLVEAVRMASYTPARVIGVDDRKGSLAAGKDADIVVFESDFTPWRVMIGGRWLEPNETGGTGRGDESN